MDFGIFIEFQVRRGRTQAEAFEESFALVEAAEDLGIDTVWLAEFHFIADRSVMASPLVAASAIASRTRRIRIGLGVQVLPLANPIRIAEEAAMVDHISKGRLDFGAGRSAFTKFYEGFNVPYSESRRLFSETLEVIMKAWTEERFSHQGEYYSFSDVNVVPKPYQQPHPPTYIAASSADSFPTIGSLGHSILASLDAGEAQTQERVEQYRKARREAGQPGPGAVLLRIPAFVAETEEEALEAPRTSTIGEIRFLADELASSAGTPEMAERLRRIGQLTYDEILRDRVIYGTPETVTERLQEYQEMLGLSGLVLEMNYGREIPYDKVLSSLRLLGEKVIPRFK